MMAAENRIRWTDNVLVEQIGDGRNFTTHSVTALSNRSEDGQQLSDHFDLIANLEKENVGRNFS